MEISASERSSVFEIEFEMDDPTYPFVGVSQAEDCTFELAEIVPRDDGQFAEFFEVREADANRILDIAADHGSVEGYLLNEYEAGGLFEFLVSEDCPAVRLARLGALPREIRGVNGEGTIVAEVPPAYDPSTVIETFLEEHPDADLTRKRTKDSMSPLFTGSAFEQVLQERLTDRQQEVLRAAFDAGYYEWPRESTGKEVAQSLGISSATFSEHVQAAERKLLALLFDCH